MPLRRNRAGRPAAVLPSTTSCTSPNSAPWSATTSFSTVWTVPSKSRSAFRRAVICCSMDYPRMAQPKRRSRSEHACAAGACAREQVPKFRCWKCRTPEVGSKSSPGNRLPDRDAFPPAKGADIGAGAITEEFLREFQARRGGILARELALPDVRVPRPGEARSSYRLAAAGTPRRPALPQFAAAGGFARGEWLRCREPCLCAPLAG